MYQTWHIFKKDARYLWREICLVLTLTLIFALTNPWWIATLVLAAASFLIARLVHAEAIPGDRQFWITRPYRWRSLLGAKLLFMFLFINLPISLAQLLMVTSHGFPLAWCLPGLLWSLVLLVLIGSLPLVALATMTPGIVAFIFPTLVLVTTWLSTALFWPGKTQLRSWPSGVEWMRDTIAVAAMAVIILAILYVQYRKRRTWLGRGIAVGGAATVAVVWWFLPWAPAWAVESRLSKKMFDSSSLQVFPNPNEIRSSRVHGRSEDELRVGLAIQFEGVPDGIEVNTDAVVITLQSADGKRWKSTMGGGTWRSSGKGKGALEVIASIGQKFIAEEHEKPFIIRGSLYLTVFGSPQAKIIPLRHTPVKAVGGLLCYLGPFDQVFCQSAFRWPGRLVYADNSPLTGIISYSPFPALMDLDPIVTQWAPSMPRSAEETTILVKEPLAHIRREFELREVRLPWLTGAD